MRKRAQETPEAIPEGTRRIMLTRPGAVACGPHRSGEVVEVDATEAARLVEFKGFEYVDQA